MSTRNPMNERYSDTERSGVSRKSASSAKPKTKAASTVTIQSQTKTARERKAARKQAAAKAADKQRKEDQKAYNPPTQRYKILRRLWWIALIAAIVCTVLSYIAQVNWGEAGAVVAVVSMVLAYVFIIAALYIDLGPTRKERKRYAAALQDKDSAEYKAWKEQDELEKAQAKADKAKAKAAYDASRNGTPAPDTEQKPAKKGLFGRKKASADGEEEPSRVAQAVTTAKTAQAKAAAAQAAAADPKPDKAAGAADAADAAK